MNVDLKVRLMLARLDLVKLKHANGGYDWSMCGEEGRKIIEQLILEIDKLIDIPTTSDMNQKSVPWQCCPKCNGDGHLGRYNSPSAYSGSTIPTCDVCNGAKIIPQAAVPTTVITEPIAKEIPDAIWKAIYAEYCIALSDGTIPPVSFEINSAHFGYIKEKVIIVLKKL